MSSQQESPSVRGTMGSRKRKEVYGVRCWGAAEHFKGAGPSSGADMDSGHGLLGTGCSGPQSSVQCV